MLKKNKKIPALLTSLAAVGVLAAVISAPRQALDAIRATCAGWWQNVLPALLPFFIITELLSRSGLLAACGVWLEPLMQPLFRLPGAAALGLCTGFFAGSPTGATVAANLRRQNLVSKNEGDRLCAFCNNAGPLYILLAVTAALGQPAAADLGLALMLAHYPINLGFGLLLRFFSEQKPTKKSRKKPAGAPRRRSPKQLLQEGWQAFQQAPALPLAQLLKQSSLAALTNIGLIGAYMLIFSLLLLALRLSGLLQLTYPPLGALLDIFQIDKAVLPALAEGCFEMTLGVGALSATSAPAFDQLLAAAIILGWSGLSVHCQIAGVVSDTDLDLRYYLPCRLLHSLAAPALLLWLRPKLAVSTVSSPLGTLPGWLTLPGLALGCSLAALLALTLLSFTIAAKKRY